MNQFIDLHSHIAWGIDDGFPTKEDAEKALKEASKNGIKAICSTPHFIYSQLNQHRMKEIIHRQKELFELAKEYGIQIYLGAEMFMDENFVNALDEGLFQTINQSKYLLAEFDVRKNIHGIEDFNDRLYEIRIRKLIPVIAHAERYFKNGLDWNILNEWIENGYVIQVNRTSLQGLHGKTIKNNAWELIKRGIASIVCTDAHRSNGHRIERLDDVEDLLVEEIGEENTNKILFINPMHLIRDEEVEKIEIKKKKRLFFWSR